MTSLGSLPSRAAVYHNVQCAACEKSGFTGFKYRCERCSGYQLCQDCFWRGQTSGAHTLQHPMKELITPVSRTAGEGTVNTW